MYKEDFEASTVNQTPPDFSKICTTKTDGGNKYITVHNTGDRRVYPNHTKFFIKMKALKWVNYETTMKFRFKNVPNSFYLRAVVRSHGVRFIDNFRSYHINIRENKIEANLRPREGEPILAKNGKVIFSDIGLSNLESNKWHTIRIRTVDNKLFVWITPDGKEEKLVNDVDMPVGAGQIAIMNMGSDAVDLDDILITDIPDPKNLK